MKKKVIIPLFSAVSLALVTIPSLSLSLGILSSKQNTTTLNQIDLSTVFNFQKFTPGVNTFYETLGESETACRKFVSAPFPATVLERLKDYVFDTTNYYSEELDISISPTNNTVTIKPYASSFHYVLSSSVTAIFEKEYYDLSTLPQSGTRVMIEFEGEPTVQDMAVALAESGFPPNQLEIPALGTPKVVKLNDYVYKAEIAPKSSSVSYANSFVVNFIKKGVTLSDIVKQKDLGVIKNEDNVAGGTLTKDQILEKLKQFNPLADEEILSTINVSEPVKKGISHTYTLTSGEEWITGNIEVNCVSVKNDSLYLKFNSNSQFYTGIPNADDGGWRDISTGIEFNSLPSNQFFNSRKIYYNPHGTQSYAKKLAIEWNYIDNSNTAVTGVAGWTENVRQVTLMRSARAPNVPNQLDLRYLYAPNLATLNTHSSPFTKYLFASIFPKIAHFNTKYENN